VFLSSNYGGGLAFTTNENLFIKKLRDWIYQRTLDVMGKGYYISWVRYSTETDYVEVNGNYYLKGATVSPNIGQGGITYFYGGLTSGNTYSFLVTAKNAIGYSGYAGPTGFRTP
jgi:hypothetical protein